MGELAVLKAYHYLEMLNWGQGPLFKLTSIKDTLWQAFLHTLLQLLLKICFSFYYYLAAPWLILVFSFLCNRFFLYGTPLGRNSDFSTRKFAFLFSKTHSWLITSYGEPGVALLRCESDTTLKSPLRCSPGGYGDVLECICEKVNMWLCVRV